MTERLGFFQQLCVMDRVNAPSVISPVVFSVAHAGRDTSGLEALARVPLSELRPLEDRYADALIDPAGPHAAVVFARPRAWIDVNREPHDLDSAMVVGVPARILSPRARGGLGLIPRRLAEVGELWRRPLTRAELDARLFDYRDFHAEIEAALAAAHAAHERAVLLDIHSMPSLANGVQVVVGNANGASARTDVTATIVTALRTAGLRVAVNAPYAGGAIVRRHGRPALDIQALQVEFDRCLYLDEALDRPGRGLPGMVALLRRIADDLAADQPGLANAAE